MIEVRYPYTGELVATVPRASVDDVRRAIRVARDYKPKLTRHERFRILNTAGELIAQRKESIARQITLESGLCLKDTLYEVGRASDVLLFSAQQALVDDGQSFSCDLTHHGKQRRVHTMREPLLGVISAITPFNHPLNQVIHKVAPSIATNNRMVLKPTEKTPLAALTLADVLYEAGLPPPMLSVVTGDPSEIADEMLTHPDVDLVTFTGGVAIGKYIAAQGGLQAADPRARRQRSAGGDGRRRRDKAAELAASGLVQEQRPALHRGQAHPGARAAGERLHRCAAGEDPRLDVWRPARPERRHGHGDRRARGDAVRASRRTTRWRRARACCTATGATARRIRPR